MAEEKLVVQLRGLRRDIAALLENQATFSKQIVRLYEHVDRLTDEVRRDFQSVKSDVIALENQNISRHGETINALRRIENVEQSGTSGGGPDAD
jgi:hypothetical protein